MNRGAFLQTIASRHEAWDMAIVGGGATGAGVAVDAASRGCSVVLLEQSDFGKGTSSRSTKLIHGGVRYLKQGNVALVAEALKERAILFQNAPHLMRNLEFIVPNYEWWEAPLYGAGLKMYDLLAAGHGFGPSKMLSRDEVLQRVPALEPKGLRGGVAYHDGQFDDSRLLINLLQTAAEHGAAILNYSRVTGFLKDAAGRIAGLAFRNGESGREYSIGARCVINATGPFCDQVRRLDDETAAPLIAPSQGAHIVLPKEFLPGDSAILVPHTADGRVMFAIPWHGHVVAGTTDTPVSEVALEPRATENEVNLILQTTGRYLARMPALADILSVFAGIRPLIKGKSTATSALRRDHAIRVSPSGLVTVAGGKWTTYRKMAEDAVDCALELACLPHRGCRTHQLPVHGFQRPQQSGPFANYGSDAEPIAALIREQPGLARPLHESLPVCGAQIVWAVRHEMAATLEDVLARRTRALFLNARAALAIAPAVARLMAIALDRDEKWEHLQLAAFQEVAAGFLPPATRAENL